MSTLEKKEPLVAGCCPTCRLVQPVAQPCGYCRAAKAQLIDKKHKGFYAEKTKRRFSLWTLILATPLFAVGAFTILAGLAALFQEAAASILPDEEPSVWTIILVCVAVGALLAATTAFGHERLPARFHSISASSLAPPGQGAVRGIARASAGAVTAHFGREHCLAACLEFADHPSDKLYFWGCRWARFKVELDSGEELVVVGPMTIVSDRPCDPPKGKAFTDILIGLGLSPNLAVPVLAKEHMLRDGDTVEIYGAVTTEAASEFADGFRDGGMGKVLRGTRQQRLRIVIKT